MSAMAQRAVPLVACALAASLWCGCSPYGSGGSFACSTDEQCGGGGTCTNGLCAFSDGECISGLRYGEFSGTRSGQCVGESMMDDASIAADVPTDVTIVPPDGTYCYGTGIVHPCFVNAPPSGTRTLNAAINTSTSNLCDASSANAAWCVIAAQTITVQGTVTVTGSKPLVLVASGTIDVQGTLDVASHRTPASTGPAANPAGCNAGNAAGNNGGGAGGSFGGKGGNGGGANNQNTGGTSGNATTNPTTLRGGCRGQNGQGGNAGAAGPGGGAVYLIAETSITISGTINASGASGSGSASNGDGGGGGGSGGYVGLDTPTVTNTGLVLANGGGGGEGSGPLTGGNSGNDPTTTTAATGGSGGNLNGGDGGNGSSGATLVGSVGSAGGGVGGGGGGGAGGGAGIIHLVRATTIAGNVSPNPT